MKIWEDRAIELIKGNVPEFDVLDTLQLEMKKAGIFSEEHLTDSRIDMAQQIIDNVKEK